MSKSISARVQQTDRKVAHKAGRKRETRLVKIAGTISDIGDQPPLIVLSVATALGGAVLRDGKVARTGLRMLAAHALATGIKSLVKHQVDRSRPHQPLNGGRYKARRGNSSDPALNSFPSGHTAGVVAVVAAVSREYPASAPVGYATAAGIAAMQVPRAQHYVSDLAAGAVIGAVAGWLSNRAFDAAERAWRERSI